MKRRRCRKAGSGGVFEAVADLCPIGHKKGLSRRIGCVATDFGAGEVTCESAPSCAQAGNRADFVG